MTDRTKITLSDIHATGETEGDSLVITVAGDIVASGVTGGSATFLDLTDSPSSYSGQGGKVVSVNTGASALEFTTPSGGSGGVDVEQNDVSKVTGATTLNFVSGATIVDAGSGQANITISGGSGGGAADFTVWVPDAPPASGYSVGGVDDDEFDDASFDTGIWTEFDVAATQTVAENEWGLRLSTTSTNTFQGVFQPVPSASDWSFTAYLGHNHGQTDDERGGILLLSDIGTLSTSDVFLWGPFRGGSGYGWSWAKALDYTGTSYFDGSWLNDSKDFHYYIRFRTDGTTWYFDMSTDGYNWVHSAYSQAKEWTPQGIGLGHRISNAAWSGDFKFARFKNDSSYSQMLYGDRVNMWRA